VRVGECEEYLFVWVNSKNRLLSDMKLTDDGYNELTDALFCGDYDTYLKPHELEALQVIMNDEELDDEEE